MAEKPFALGKLLVAALCLLFACGVFFLAFQLQQVQMPPSPNSPLVGTWKTSAGRVVNFRSDGTARFRGASGGKARQILYFEWMLDSSNNLVRRNECSSAATAWKCRLHTFLSGEVLGELPMALVNVSDSGFTLRTAEGLEFSYFPAEDRQMESAP